MGERSVRSPGQRAVSIGSEGGKSAHWLLSDQGGNYANLKGKGDKYRTFVLCLSSLAARAKNQQAVENQLTLVLYKITLLYNNPHKWQYLTIFYTLRGDFHPSFFIPREDRLRWENRQRFPPARSPESGSRL